VKHSHAIEDRLDALERTVRTQRAAACWLGLPAVLIVGLGARWQGESVSPLLKTQRLEIVGVDGKARIVAEARGEQTILRMLGANGIPRLEVCTDLGGIPGCNFQLCDSKGIPRTAMSSTDGTGVVSISSSKFGTLETSSVEISTDKKGAGRIEVSNAAHVPVVSLSAVEGHGAVTVCSAKMEPYAMLLAGDRLGFVSLSDVEGGKVFLSSSPVGPGLTLQDKSGSVRAFLGLTTKGDGTLELQDRTGSGFCKLATDSNGNGTVQLWARGTPGDRRMTILPSPGSGSK